MICHDAGRCLPVSIRDLIDAAARFWLIEDRRQRAANSKQRTELKLVTPITATIGHMAGSLAAPNNRALLSASKVTGLVKLTSFIPTRYVLAADRDFDQTN